jgi:hypothetical protein
MEKKRIRKFCEAANAADNQKNFYDVAFALRYMAYEGVISRICVKALWIRGARVKDAEKTIASLRNVRVSDLLRKSLNNQAIHPLMTYISKNSHLRNNLFHNTVVQSQKDVRAFSRLLKAFLLNPEASLKEIGTCYDVDGEIKWHAIGDPFSNLKGAKRPQGVVKAKAADLLGFSSENYQSKAPSVSIRVGNVIRKLGDPHTLADRDIDILCGK